MGSFSSWTSDILEAAMDDEQLGDDQNIYDEQLEETSEVLRSPPETIRVSVDLNQNRIPSSIFSSKPATATDWSTASTESLFSIHVANGSYSKEQFFVLHKSGELTKLDERIINGRKCNILPPLNELEDKASVNESAEDHTHSFVFPVLKGTTDQDNKELQEQQSTGELQKQTPVKPQSCFSCIWFSWFNCCGCSCFR